MQAYKTEQSEKNLVQLLDACKPVIKMFCIYRHAIECTEDILQECWEDITKVTLRYDPKDDKEAAALIYTAIRFCKPVQKFITCRNRHHFLFRDVLGKLDDTLDHNTPEKLFLAKESVQQVQRCAERFLSTHRRELIPRVETHLLRIMQGDDITESGLDRDILDIAIRQAACKSNRSVTSQAHRHITARIV
jgi:hypothetical protein